MHFEPGGIYHIYNQGNNRQKIFFNRENYKFFVQKIEGFVKPYGSILAWCLMPNHFHLMVEVESVTIGVSDGVSHPADCPATHPVTKQEVSHPVDCPATHPVTKQGAQRTLNDSIGIMLRSYTRAINIQENRTGGLFREETKAICLNEIKGISSNWFTSFGVTFLNVQIPERQYLQACFNYIHSNPVKAGLVRKPEDWEFSSYAYLKEIRYGDLININRIIELGLLSDFK